MIKIIKSGKEARDAIKRGIDACANLVKTTLGPAGRNVLIWRQNQWPLSTDDGVTIAKKMDVVDETENLGLLTFVNGSIRANDIAGDGTTSTIIIAQKIIEEAFQQLDLSDSTFLKDIVIDSKGLSDEILRRGEEVCEKLDAMKKPIETREQLIRVAQIAVKDKEMGEVIGDMVWKLGRYAYVSVEDSYGSKIESDIINGLNFNGKPVVDWTFNDKREIDFPDTGIIVTNQEIRDGFDFIRKVGEKQPAILLELLNSGTKTCVIFAPKFSIESMHQFAKWWAGGYNIIPIKVPSLTNEQLEDVAIYTGSTFVDTQKGSTISRLVLSDIGKAIRVHLKDEKVSLYGGGGTKQATEKRVEALKKQLEKEEDDLFKKKMERRLSALSGGIGKIRVGSDTDVQKGYLVKKIEDGVRATICAFEEGIIQGGGIPLKEIAESMDKNILTEALKAPHEQLKINGGKDFTVNEGVFDPIKVTKTAVKMACSVASMMVMTEGTIALKRLSLMDDLQAGIRTDKRFEDKIPERDLEKDRDDYWNAKAGDV